MCAKDCTRLENAMAFQSVLNTALLEYVYSRSGTINENTLHVERPAGYDLTDLTSLADLLDARWVTSFKPLIGAGVTYLRTQLTGLESINDLTVSNSDGTGAGSAAGTLLPANVTKSITLRTGLTGRSARGRFYTVGMTTNHLQADTNLITTAYRDAILAALNALRSDCLSLGWLVVVTSRITEGEVRPLGQNFSVTSFGVFDLTTDSRRDRLP
jgi:hypothetical protein